MKKERVIEDDHKPTDEEVRRYGQKQKNKKVPSAEWVSTTDPSSRIARLEDGRTHFAYKADRVVDLPTELLLAAEVYHSDAQTLCDSLMEARTNLSKAGLGTRIKEVIADRGYHSADQLELPASVGVRT